ncbi:AraC family transcriptional regulator [Intrasporangium oryzae NRRL B-24470]|uniref:AraC family transcriptional regulator n=1 Tax=Intrasporangium oryzae NRRL B-24470 TaxID=1386089 RepID=W9G8R0_9MICO|nr:AraC family transcriptional regulator [Intrasporangium oryzae]EWT00259.1 AraC family transcriptional regulator [Intrasporangium oryzae NRRL B-24470]
MTRPFVRSATLNGYLGLARSLGLDGPTLMRKVGIEPADLAVPDKWIPAAAVARLLDVSATASGRTDFSVRLAEERRLSTLGPLSVVLREEPDLRSALRLLMRYEHSYNEALRMRLDETGEIATVRLWFEFGEPVPSDQALTLGAAALHGIVRECVGPHWRPLACCFQSRAPADLEAYDRVFGASLQFEHDFTGLVIYARDLSAANPLADPLMRPYAQRFLESVVSPRATTSRERVQELMEFLLPLGRCTMDHIARTLGVDRRTLHRHLADEGVSFSSLLHSTRAGLAEHYLANDRYSMTDICHLLGFTAPSAFTRWFHQQFGMSPSAWRSTSRA